MWFAIDRVRLHTFIEGRDDYADIYEPTLGYAGVNIKFRMPDELVLPDIEGHAFNTLGEHTRTFWIPYADFLQRIKRKPKADYYVTFLVFQSGKIIMSGKDCPELKRSYTRFVALLEDHKELVQELIVARATSD